MTPSRTAEARPARVLVVGSGIAGLTAALTAASCGAEVVIVTKARVDDAATTRAQGGIAGVIFPDDALADHAADTMRASAGLADPDAVRALVAGGTEAIAWLIDHGVRFDRDAAGVSRAGSRGRIPIRGSCTRAATRPERRSSARSSRPCAPRASASVSARCSPTSRSGTAPPSARI
jgi:aspartate oxidase